MTALVARALERLLGRLPIGWLQLAHNRTRLLAAVAGVTFADVLVLMQLGFKGALVGSIGLPYAQFDADLMISSSDVSTLGEASPVPRQRLLEALGVPGVASAVPLYYGKIEWKQPDGTVRVLDTFGVDPSVSTLKDPEIASRLPDLVVTDAAILDRRTRNVPREVFARLDAGEAFSFEDRGRTVDVVGAFTIGGGFSADGYLVVSDQTFLKLFPQRVSGAPSHVFVRVAEGADPAGVERALRAALPAEDSVVQTVAEALRRDTTYQTTRRPVGIIFGFGVIMGVVVGVIIVYQVLSTDVADHLREYATFKAMGYRDRFFLGIILEEAMVLATLGFVPALGISLGLYAAVMRLTGLPVGMTAGRAAAVLVGTVAMCALSGAIATRRLARADPAELF